MQVITLRLCVFAVWAERWWNLMLAQQESDFTLGLWWSMENYSLWVKRKLGQKASTPISFPIQISRTQFLYHLVLFTNRFRKIPLSDPNLFMLRDKYQMENHTFINICTALHKRTMNYRVLFWLCQCLSSVGLIRATLKSQEL